MAERIDLHGDEAQERILREIDRPEFVSEEHLTYLDQLRESGRTNMFGARPYLMAEFGLSGAMAAKILSYWMESFGERHPR